MNSDNTKVFRDEVETGIAGYLRQVRRHLDESGQSTTDETDGIVKDLESQIRSQLDAAAGSDASMADFCLVQSRMDPPDHFGGDSPSVPSLDARGHAQISHPLLKWAGMTLLIVMVAGLVYYLIADVTLSRGSNVTKVEPPPLPRDTPARQDAAPAARPAPIAVTAPGNTPAADSACAKAPPARPGKTAPVVVVTDFSTSDNIRNRDVVAATVADGLISALAIEERVCVVERAKLRSALQELRMGAEGTLDQATAMRLGKMTGAQVMITGNIVEIDSKLIITARLINPETSELAAARVAGTRAELLSLVDDLVRKITERVCLDSTGTFARHTSDDESAALRERQSKLKQSLEGRTLPRLLVMIPETHLLSPRVPDPAGETELVLWLTDCGFTVTSPEHQGVRLPDVRSETTDDTNITFRRNRGLRNEEGNVNISNRLIHKWVTGGLDGEKETLAKTTDLIILGEGISERSHEREGLISCKARLELKVIDIQTGRIVASKSTYGTGIDVAERIAGKRALQDAGRNMAFELIPELAKK